jgi:uncharacterized membrane protein required for colicin V production
MYLDIGLSVFLFVCLALGWFKGFLNGIIGFVSGVLSLAAAIVLAKRVSNLLDKWFHIVAELNKLVKGTGPWLSVLLCGIAIYLLCRLFFWGTAKAIRKFKEDHKLIDQIDRIAGLFLGLAKCALGVSILFIVVYLLSSIPFMSHTVDWFLKGSKIGKYLYDNVVKFIIPLIGGIKAAIL